MDSAFSIPDPVGDLFWGVFKPQMDSPRVDPQHFQSAYCKFRLLEC